VVFADQIRDPDGHKSTAPSGKIEIYSMAMAARSDRYGLGAARILSQLEGQSPTLGRMIDFKKIKWIDPYNVDDVVVRVSVSKVEERWRLDKGYYLSPRTCQRQTRYWKFDEWIKTHTEVWMPVLTLMDDGRIAFTDGRHRFSWFRDHGLMEMRVLTGRGEGAALRRAVGR
jgi:hypothetical protein